MINLWRSIRFTVVFALLLGLAYPLVVVGIGGVFFPYQAQGSLITINDKIVGSELIAQSITSSGLFHPRPSAVNYAANGSGGSNLGPTNPALLKEVRKNIQSVNKIEGQSAATIPPDMVQSSASGLDPDISVQAAMLQIPRIASASGVSEPVLRDLVNQHTTGRFLGIWGSPHVNVMKLNVDLLKAQGKYGR